MSGKPPPPAMVIGLSGDQVYQRRRVWETLAPVRSSFPSLKWSHYYTALNWEDAGGCLRWAEDMKATVAEMKAWRRAQRGEDLSADPISDEIAQFIPAQVEVVQDPAQFAAGGRRVAGGSNIQSGGNDLNPAPLAGVARELADDEEPYAPYRSGAGSPPPTEKTSDRSETGPTPPSAEQLVKRMSFTLEKCTRLLTPAFIRQFRGLSPEIRGRFFDAVKEFNNRVDKLET